MPLPIVTTLGDRVVAQVLSRAQEQNTRARQAAAAKRVLIMSENWRTLVYAYIGTQIKTDTVKVAISRRVKRTFNVMRQLVARACVSYKIPPVRSLEGASEAAQEAFAGVLKEACIATRAKKWERDTFAHNVAHVIPVVREHPDGRGPQLSYQIVLPHCAEVTTSVQDPMAPAVLVYTAKDGSDFSQEPLQTIAIDDEAWRYYGRNDAAIRTKPHGAGVFPGVPFRLEDPEDDYWLSHRGSGIEDATIEVAYRAARMDWIRDQQDRKREVFYTESMAKVPKQVAGADGPMHIPLNPNAAKLDVLDTETSIDEFMKHIRVYLHQAAESLGIPSVLVDFDPGATNYANVTSTASANMQAALAEVRQSHIDFYEEHERELAWKTALVLRGSGHPAAKHLEPDMVYDKFRIEFPELSFTQDPMARAGVSEKKVTLGLSSTFREYQAWNPHLTREQAREQVLAIAEEEGELNQFYIEHNIPRAAADRMKTLAQVQGKIGGEASGEQRNDDDDDDTERGRERDGDERPGGDAGRQQR
jgi:hypothetical protein